MASGMLASRYGFAHLSLQVLQSAAGYYIGTFDNWEGPVSRESVEYYQTRSEAEAAFATNSWTQRQHP